MILKHAWLVFLLGLLATPWTVFAQIPPGAIWIDVRTPGEYDQGHVAGAELIPFDAIEAGVRGRKIALDTPILLYCRSGGRSGMAKARLDALGYSNVTNVGGLEQARQLAAQSASGPD